MNRLLYLSVWDFTEEEQNGICKKIKNQEKVFADRDFQVDRAYICDKKACVRLGDAQIILGKVGLLGKVKANKLFYRFLKEQVPVRPYTAVYIRYGLSDKYFYKLCKLLKKNGARIIIEIPTYPYEGEATRGLKDKIGISLDHKYRKKLSRYVDRIATFTDDPQIWNIPAYHIQNGIDTTQISPRKTVHGFDCLNLMAVANVGPWHGYDRLLEAMGRYYENGGSAPVCFHLVGEGAELDNYRKIVEQHHLQERVVFHGPLFGEALATLYEEMDLAVETLGMHRKGIVLSSSLKSREYALKGLPMITSCKLDAFPAETCDFVCMLPEGEEPINLEDILRFYKKLFYNEQTGECDLEKKKLLSERISEYARTHCDMHETMKQTVAYLKGENA